MKISVVMPVLNEVRFVRGWLDNVRKFADEIIVIDMGSTDGTFDYLYSNIDVDILTKHELETEQKKKIKERYKARR